MKAEARRWRWHAQIGLGYLLLAVLLTFPAILHFFTHLPGDGGDDPAIAWNLWWVKYSLLNLGQNPFDCRYMFYPLGVNLAFYTLTTLNAFQALPLLLNAGTVAASNCQLLLNLTLNAYGSFLLVAYILATWPGLAARREWIRWPAATAGLIVAFAGSKLFYASLGQVNIVSSHWTPFALLYILRFSRPDRGSYRDVILAALFIVLQAWTELTYASFLVIFLGVLYTWKLLLFCWERRRSFQLGPADKAAGRTYARRLLLLALLVAAGVSPILGMMLPDMARYGDFFVEGSGFAEAFSSDLLGFFIPTMRHAFLGGLIAHSGVVNFDKGQHVYLGYSLLLLAGVGFWRYRRQVYAWFWLLASFFFAWLCLGPMVTFNGRALGLPGPFVLLQSLPFFKGNRYPSRFSVMLLLTLAPLAALGIIGLYRLWVRAHSNVRVSGLATLSLAVSALFLLEHLSIPLPLSDMRLPLGYELIARDAGDFAVLDIPFAWRNGFRITGPLDPGFMFGQFYQTAHQKRLLEGNTSRNPEFKFQYFTQAPLLNSLLALETGKSLPAGRQEGDRRIAGEILRFFDIRYLVVRAYHGHDPQVTPWETLPYIEDTLPVQKIFDGAETKIYRTLPPEPQKTTDITPGEPLATLYLGEGWNFPPGPAGSLLAAQNDQVTVFVPVGSFDLRFSARLRLPFGAGRRQFWLSSGSWNSERITLSEAWQEIQLDIPAPALKPGLNELRLNFDGTIPLAAAREPLDVRVVSAGMEVGNLGHIYVNGRDVSPNLPGYNIAVIDPAGGQVESRNFNTFRRKEASAELAAYIRQVPDGRIVAVAAMDTVDLPPEYGGPVLGREAVEALQSLGSTADLQGKFRWSQALIAVKGQSRAVEQVESLAPASAALGNGATAPNVAAFFSGLRFEAVNP